MKTPRWLIPVLIFFTFTFVTPVRAKADTVSMVEGLLNVVSKIDTSIPTGDQMATVLGCLQKADVANLQACAELVTGPDGLPVDSGSPYMAAVDDVIQIFGDIGKGDYDDILAVVVTWVGTDAPCIVADVIFPGVGGDLCELAKELIEAAVEAGQDIVKFFVAVGEGFYDVGEAIYCYFTDCSSSPPPPEPPQQVIYEHYLEPKLGAGLTVVETKGWAELQDIINTVPYSEVSSIVMKSGLLSVSDPQDEINQFIFQAGEEFKVQVKANWAADMPKTVIPALLEQRASIGSADVFNWWVTAAGKMASNWADPYASAPYDVSALKIGWIDDFAAKVGPECMSAFASTLAYSEVDDWIKGYPDDAMKITEDGSPGLMTNADWCKLHTGPMISSMTQSVTYMPPNCPKQPKPGSPYMYRCTTLVAYANCYALKGLNLDSHTANPCGMNVPMVGQSAAQTLPLVCSTHVADYAPNTDVPVEVDCPSASVISCGKSQMYSKLPQQLLSLQVKADPWYTALEAKVDGVVWLVSHGQDPHGTPPPPEKISDRDVSGIKLNEANAANVHPPLNQNTGPVKDSVGNNKADLTNRQAINPNLLPGEHREDAGTRASQTVTETNAANRAANINIDQATGRVRAPGAGGAAIGAPLTAPKACLNRIQVSDIDPLIVYTEPCVFQSLQSNPNQDFGFKDKNGKTLKWYYPDYYGDMNRLMQDEHPSSCSIVTAPVLFVAFQPTGSEAAVANANKQGSSGQGDQSQFYDYSKPNQTNSGTGANATPPPLPIHPGMLNQNNRQPAAPPIPINPNNPIPLPPRQGQQPAAPASASSAVPIPIRPGELKGIAQPGQPDAGAAAPLCANQPPDTKEAIDNFKISDANWKGLPPPMEPRPACNCADDYKQINAIDQHSAALIKAGEEILQALTSCNLNADKTIKAKDGLADITNQLHQSRFQRNALVTQYQAKMMSVRPK